jgi:monoamine oxidase
VDKLSGARARRLGRNVQVGGGQPAVGDIVTARWNNRSTLDYWTGYPWIRGSCSFWKVGRYTKLAGVERERQGNCHFAGEHTSIDFQGYLNGAVETGERAADEVLGDLR